jgi:hypothetical protein
MPFPDNILDPMARIIAAQPTLISAGPPPRKGTHFEKHGAEFASNTMEDYVRKIKSTLTDAGTKVVLSVDAQGKKRLILEGRVDGPGGKPTPMFIAINQHASGEINGTAFLPNHTFTQMSHVLPGQKTSPVTGGLHALEKLPGTPQANGLSAKTINAFNDPRLVETLNRQLHHLDSTPPAAPQPAVKRNRETEPKVTALSAAMSAALSKAGGAQSSNGSPPGTAAAGVSLDQHTPTGSAYISPPSARRRDNLSNDLTPPISHEGPVNGANAAPPAASTASSAVIDTPKPTRTRPDFNM